MKTNAAFAIFKSKEKVQQAEQALVMAGFSPTAISILIPRTDGTKEFHNHYQTNVMRFAEFGAAIGLIVGALFGMLAGSEDPSLPIFASSGNMWLGFVFGAVLGAIFGGGAGALVGIGTPVSATERYARYLDEGGIVLEVHADNFTELHRAMAILDMSEGEDVSSSSEDRLWSAAITHGLPRRSFSKL